MPVPKKFRFSFSQKVDWADMDALGHVNHLMYARYFENARVEFLSKMGLFNANAKDSAGPVITHLELNFRKQVVYPAILEVTLDFQLTGTRKFRSDCSMWTEDGECAVSGFAEFIWFNFQEGRPGVIPESLKARLQEWEDESGRI